MVATHLVEWAFKKSKTTQYIQYNRNILSQCEASRLRLVIADEMKHQIMKNVIIEKCRVFVLIFR